MSLDKTEKEKTKTNYFREFSLKTTIHGLPNIAEAESSFQRIFWILVTIGGSVTCFALIVVSIVSYFSFEVSVSYSIVNESPAIFPAVTICNIVPFNISGNKTFFENILNENDLNFDVEPTDTQPGINQVTSRRNLLIAQIISNKELNLTSLGFSIQSMLISCTFNNNPCSKQDFYQYYDNNYGNCYTFNYENKKPKYTSKYGPKYGFKLELFAGLPARDDYFSTERGIFLAVTNNSVLPVSNYDGIKLAVGSATDVKVTRTFYSKLDSPYSKCRLDTIVPHKKDSDLFNRTLQLNNYSIQLCYDLCLQKNYIEQECNCSDPSLYQFNTSMPICNTLSALNCTHVIKDKFDTQRISDKCDKYCPTPCNSIKYQTSCSFSKYPSFYYLEILDKTPSIREKFKEYLTINTSLTQIQSIVESSILKVNVYYDDLSYIFINESEAVTFVSVLGTIGGHLGLFIGMSVLSFFEFFEIGFKILFSSLSNKKKTLKQKIGDIEIK